MLNSINVPNSKKGVSKTVGEKVFLGKINRNVHMVSTEPYKEKTEKKISRNGLYAFLKVPVFKQIDLIKVCKEKGHMIISTS